ncbi:EFR1 family ferrodoxin [Eubacterium multiforme]|uniref:Ferredoxin n=1 Tax=Eubacterium multiforme TaxID=83339 RepID=A0ABT9UVY1_9FIRM|nr:EFR1 family ferrodoxin [Eubacterium multiforme]MDQ0150481.1 ferredoxin [Eubacterium multiforme]
MIFYFTGTGNSGDIARRIVKENNDKIVSISEFIKEGNELNFNLKDDEIIGFVYPVYAWAPPKIVREFIRKAKFNNYKNNYIFSVATCGNNVGNTMKIIEDELNNKGMKLNSGFSIVMPNNYIILGDVDSKEVQSEKLEKAKISLEEINSVIKKKENGVFKLKKGFMPSLLTKVVNPLFQKNAINISKFYSTDECISCGICSEVCNLNTIKIVDGRPKWSGECCQCLACINYCPKNAIQYGNKTIKKGRYTNPNFKPNNISGIM